MGLAYARPSLEKTMNREIIAKDSDGVPRCYGLGHTHQEAMQQCTKAAIAYLAERPDIDKLYLFNGESDKPIIDAARYEQWTISNS